MFIFLSDYLLCANILDGVLLITSYGEQIYCWGPKIDDVIIVLVRIF